MAPVVPAISAAATAFSTASAGTQLMTGLRIVSGFMKLKQGLDRARDLRRAANYEILEGRVEAVRERERGVEILRRMKVALADNIALTGATGFDFADATIQNRMTFGVMRPGSIEYSTSRDNRAMAMMGANRRAADFRSAAKSATMTGVIGFLGDIGGAGQDLGLLGTGQSPTTMPSAPVYQSIRGPMQTTEMRLF